MLCSALPAALFATGDVTGGAADPRPMLLWYVALAVPTLVSLVVGVLSIVDFFARKSDHSKAAALGGYVTHPQLSAELEKVYTAVRNAVKEGTSDLARDMRDLTKSVNANAAELHRIEGQLEGLPARRPGPKG